jgi:hypothetical protein
MQEVTYDYIGELAVIHVCSALTYIGLELVFLPCPHAHYGRFMIRPIEIITPEADEHAESVGA